MRWTIWLFVISVSCWRSKTLVLRNRNWSRFWICFYFIHGHFLVQFSSFFSCMLKHTFTTQPEFSTYKYYVVQYIRTDCFGFLYNLSFKYRKFRVRLTTVIRNLRIEEQKRDFCSMENLFWDISYKNEKSNKKRFWAATKFTYSITTFFQSYMHFRTQCDVPIELVIVMHFWHHCCFEKRKLLYLTG
jgi:hypothetical protein